MFSKTSKLTAIVVAVAATAAPGALALRMPDVGATHHAYLKPVVLPRAKSKPASTSKSSRTLILPSTTPVLAGSPRGGAIEVG
jgi:hypothetical protein